MTIGDETAALRVPLAPGQPCGVSMDGSPLLLSIESANLFGQRDHASLEPIDWSRFATITRDGLRASKDLRLLSVYAAASLHTEGLAAFLDLLPVAAYWVDQYWADLHPGLDGGTSRRADALRQLADPAAVIAALSVDAVAPQLARGGTGTIARQLTAAIDATRRLESVLQSHGTALDLSRLRQSLEALASQHIDPVSREAPAMRPATQPSGAARVSRGVPRSAPPPAPAAAPPPPAAAQAPPSEAPPRAIPMGRTSRGMTRSRRPEPTPPFDGAAPDVAAAAPAPATGAAPPPAPAAPAPATKVECHVLAEMDPEVVVNETTTVEVALSREALTATAGRTSAGTGAVSIDADKTLIVQVVPRANIVLAPGTSERVEVAPPAPGQPTLLYFDVTGAHEGAGEIWVIVRQHQMGVARLVLKPAVVASRSTTNAPRMAAAGDAIQAPPLAQPLDQLDIFEQTIGNTVQYLFQLEMPSLNVLRLFTSPPLETSREDYVNALYKEIETRYVSSFNEATKQADVAAFTAQLQAQGVALFDRLFPFELQVLLWKHRDQIRSVRVVSTEPFIPWEIVHLREPGVPLDPAEPTRFLGQMGLVRWLHNVNGLPPDRITVRSGRARYVIPDYVDPRLKLPVSVNERLYLQNTFAATPIEAQPVPLQQALSAPGTFDLLHLACHGEADIKSITSARIVLQGRDEEEIISTYMNASTVETFARLRAADGAQPIVFLNACQAGRSGYQLSGIGGFAQAFLRAGAGAFVGTLWSVADQPAFFFGKAFYEALRGGASLSEAAIAAREGARRDDATWLAYVVYGHPHARVTFER